MWIRSLFVSLLVWALVAGPAMAQVTGPITPIGPVCVDTAPSVDIRRSLFVTELDVVQQAISLEDVMSKLASDSADPAMSPKRLWKQWWDTQNEAESGIGLGSNCDDVANSQGEPAINGFPIQCPRNEGAEVDANPFIPGEPSFYEPLALVNRFDLAPRDGANCGEYRIIFARHSGATEDFNRNLVIFEAVLPNPNPNCGLEGCRMVARFWQGLSRTTDPAIRAEALRRFYLEGFPSRGIPPVIHAKHFGPGTGQIRTNQFMSGDHDQLWQLREFKLARLCDAETGSCSLQFVPVTVKGNPFGELFDASIGGEPRTRQFQRHYRTQVENLSAADLNEFFAAAPDRFNAGQSNSQEGENNYPAHLEEDPRFQRALTERLRFLGIRLDPEHLARRSLALSCAGCHQLSNGAPNNDLGGLTWRPSLGFVHVSEQQTDVIDGNEHFRISPALEEVFLPHRAEIFERYLDKVSCSDCRSIVLESDASGGMLPIPVEVEAGFTLDDVTEKVRALDAELKAGDSGDTIGGKRRVH